MVHSEVQSNSCEFVVGRLMEIRVAAGYHTVADVEQMMAMMQQQISRLRADEKFVIAADWRNVTVMPPDTAARARDMLANSNPRVIRSSILLRPGQATTSLQVLRLVKEAENDNRRYFIAQSQQIKWLSEVLKLSELTRLRSFLEAG